MKKSRKDQRACRHIWVRVFNVHSWPYQCRKCGACSRPLYPYREAPDSPDKIEEELSSR